MTAGPWHFWPSSLVRRGLSGGMATQYWRRVADRRGKLTCPFCSSRSHMENPGWSPSSNFSQDGAPGTAAVPSCTFSFHLSWALKLQLPGTCSLWLLQREKLFEKEIPELWTITHVKEVMKPMYNFSRGRKKTIQLAVINFG